MVSVFSPLNEVFATELTFSGRRGKKKVRRSAGTFLSFRKYTMKDSLNQSPHTFQNIKIPLKLYNLKVVGYVRKSPTDKNHENICQLINSMARNKRERSLVTRVYIRFIVNTLQRTGC
ncbi:hypothetical protein BD770DRAFT_391074 [Pilaira anomala]|nr:hypothetical protein BD770DRAFT_391074 [Pilaira anomala]